MSFRKKAFDTTTTDLAKREKKAYGASKIIDVDKSDFALTVVMPDKSQKQITLCYELGIDTPSTVFTAIYAQTSELFDMPPSDRFLVELYSRSRDLSEDIDVRDLDDSDIYDLLNIGQTLVKVSSKPMPFKTLDKFYREMGHRAPGESLADIPSEVNSHNMDVVGKIIDKTRQVQELIDAFKKGEITAVDFIEKYNAIGVSGKAFTASVATPVNVSQIAREIGAMVVDQSTLCLNDDLIHKVVIVSDEGTAVPGVLIKDLDKDDSGMSIELAYLNTFIAKLQSTEAELLGTVSKFS